MKYHIQEGTFSVGNRSWLDNSLNILRNDQDGISIVISRGPIPEDCDFEQAFIQQWSTLREQMGRVKQSAFERISAGPLRQIRAIEVVSEFEHHGQYLFQRQLAVQVPDTAVLLVITYSSQHGLSEQELQQWDELKSTLILNPTDRTPEP